MASDARYWSKGDPLDGPERWYPIAGYEGLYEVSTLGRVARIAGGRGARGPFPRILKATLNADGYPTVRLSKNAKPLTCNVHVLVAVAYHEIPKDMIEPEVDHINEDRADCRAINLQYLSKAANLAKRYERKPEDEPTDADVSAMAKAGAA
jgi:hypothetical protein